MLIMMTTTTTIMIDTEIGTVVSYDDDTDFDDTEQEHA